jgi:hypothetical protein
MGRSPHTLQLSPLPLPRKKRHRAVRGGAGRSGAERRDAGAARRGAGRSGAVRSGAARSGSRVGAAPGCDAQGTAPELGAHVGAAREHPQGLPARAARHEPLVVGVQREDDEAKVHEAEQREPPARGGAGAGGGRRARCRRVGGMEAWAYHTALLNSGMGRALARDSNCLEARDLTWYLFRASMVQPCSFRVMV